MTYNRRNKDRFHPTLAEATYHQTGITLRDWFAGQALAGILANTPDDSISDAQTAYIYADAMLCERDQE